MPGIKDPPTMSSENPKFDEIRKVILSLLLSRKGLVPVPVLDRDYYEMEGERIPWRKFGFTDLVAFLKSMPQHVTLEWQNGCQCVRGIASEKSKHVSSLVSRQRNDLKARTSHLRNSHSYSHPHRSNPRYIPHMQRQQYRIPPEQLHFIVQCVRNHPNGLKIQKILAILQQQLPRITLSIHDVCRQLRELSHQISLDGDVIYPVRSNDAPQEAATCQNSSVPQMRPAYRDLQTETVCVAGDEEGYEIADTSFEEPYSVPGCARSNYHKGQSTGERLAGNFSQGAYHEQMTFEYNSHGDNKKTDGYFTANCNNIDNNKSDSLDDRCADISTLIHGRIKGRLEQLIRKYPEGIYCTELPDKYLEEYKVRLNYNELGFSSVREYVSYLPNIFYMTHVASADDFKLFSADKRPTIPEETSASQKTESTTRGSLPDKRHDEQIPAWKQYNSDDAVPTNVSPTITSKFTPDDVMNHKDSVKVISVTDLQRKKYQEVYLAEVFTPSFFWIHLRENKSLLLSLMGNLQSFYVANHQSYAIPKVSLSKGLNCACVFSQRWHRAIIKSVKPDFRVTVMFYDFGTLKTYPPEHIYYLHKQFSHLPALAIPCGLYGIKPCVGDRWKKSVTEQFADKTGDNLLVADIVSVDLPHNSMMVTLTDRSEEEHVNLNDWLVNQNLARQGKLVRICMCVYLNNITQDSTVAQSSCELTDTRNEIDVRTRYEEDQSVSCNEEMRRLSNSNHPTSDSSDEDKNIEISHDIPFSRQTIAQILRDMNFLSSVQFDVKPDARLDSSDCAIIEQSKGSRGLVALFDKLKALNNCSMAKTISDVAASEVVNGACQNDARRLDPKVEADRKILDSDKQFKSPFNMCFTVRESDDDEADFGTFRSFYGGHGLMQPVDWSMIEKEKAQKWDRRVVPTSINNLDDLIQEHVSKSNDAKDETGSTCKRKEGDEMATKPYFLNMTRKLEECSLVEGNIDYDMKNVSQAVARLRKRMQTCNDDSKKMIVPIETMKTLFDDVQSQDTNSEMNVDGMSSSRKKNQDKKNEEDGSEEARGANREKEKRNFNAEQRLMSSKTDKKKKSKQRQEASSDDSFESNTTNMTSKVANAKHKLLEHIKLGALNDSSSVDTSGSSSIEQVRSSSSRSFAEDTLISSDDRQDEACTRKDPVTRFSKLRDLVTCASAGSRCLKSDCNSENNDLPTENDCPNLCKDSEQDKLDGQLRESDSVGFWNNEASKKPSEDDSAVPCESEDSKQHQVNAPVTGLLKSTILQHLLKMKTASSDVELDSDDLSSEPSLANDESGENGDKRDNESPDKSVDQICESIDTVGEVDSSLVFDDRDLESDDDTWDVNESPFLPVFEHLRESAMRNIEISEGFSDGES